jgi:cobalt-precorrin-6B (C15)-methyltransferase
LLHTLVYIQEGNNLKEFNFKAFYLSMMRWNYITPGIPDELFERSENVPITKEDIRSIVLSKLRLRKNYSVIDVGCGSGSITVEVCLQLDSKNVYAIDLDKNAIELTKKNLDKFGVSANLIYSKAEEILPSLPTVDAIIVGGTKGKTEKIVELCISKLKEDGRLVIDTILIETMYKALRTIKKEKMHEIEVTQVTISKGKDVPSGTMLVSRNPILILSATKQ